MISDTELIRAALDAAAAAGPLDVPIGAVVFGAWEPKTGAVGSLWEVVRDRRLTHRPQVCGGVLADECAAPLEEFFARRR